jgi:MFS family permease
MTVTSVTREVPEEETVPGNQSLGGRGPRGQESAARREEDRRERRGRRFAAKPMYSSLRHHNFRLFLFSLLVSVMGTWMESIAQSFLVLGLTHSGIQLGLTLAARFLPILFFGPMGGLFADRCDKQRVLFVTQTLPGLVSATFAVLIATHSIRLWMVYLLALTFGFASVFDTPARQSLISEMVPADDLPNAVTLNSVAINMARVFGAVTGGGIVATLGMAVCFGADAMSFGVVLISLGLMNKALLYPARRVGKKKGQIVQGLRYVRSTPELLIPLVMIAVVGTLAWEFQVSLPLMATKVLGGGVESYGLMASVMGVGAVFGGLVSAARPRPQVRALCLSAVGWGIAILAAALAPTMPVELVTMLFVGYGSITFNCYAKTVLQLAAKPEMRGRVMALWALAWSGSTPIGGAIVGWVGQEFGARWSLIIGGGPTMLCGLLAYPALAAIDRRIVSDREAGSRPDAISQAEAVSRPEARVPEVSRFHSSISRDSGTDGSPCDP